MCQARSESGAPAFSTVAATTHSVGVEAKGTAACHCGGEQRLMQHTSQQFSAELIRGR